MTMESYLNLENIQKQAESLTYRINQHHLHSELIVLQQGIFTEIKSGKVDRAMRKFEYLLKKLNGNGKPKKKKNKKRKK